MGKINNNYEGVAPRITVLDANEVDSVIFHVFKSQLDNIFRWLPPWILSKFGPEVTAILKLAIWKVSIDKSKASFGQQLLHLKYRNDSKLWKLRILGLATIGGPYVKERISDLVSDNQSMRKINSMIDGLETLIKLMNIYTFINFLRNGGAPSFLEYILGLIPVSTVTSSKRNVGYSYMMRELIWHGFIELLVIIIPFINYSKVKRKLTKMMKGSIPTQPPSSKCTFSTNSLCVVCCEPPILPHEMGCSHCFCFYCLSTNIEADKMFECPECGYSNPDKATMKPVQS